MVVHGATFQQHCQAPEAMVEWENWACGGIGIRVRFRTVSRKGWRFESSLAHFFRLPMVYAILLRYKSKVWFGQLILHT